MLQLGSLLQPEEALSIGLVDELVEHGTALARAHDILAMYVKVDPNARASSKLLLRSRALDRLRNSKEADIDQFIKFCMSEKVQRSLGLYLEMLKKGSKKK